jgi:sulfur carrier protein
MQLANHSPMEIAGIGKSPSDSNCRSVKSLVSERTLAAVLPSYLRACRATLCASQSLYNPATERPIVRICVNGDQQQLDGPVSVAELLRRFDLAPQRVAVEINEQLVRRVQFEDVKIADGDRIEIVTLVGGG